MNQGTEGDSERWHEGLHRLTDADSRFELFTPLDMHIVPCELPAERMRTFLNLAEGRTFFDALAADTRDPVLARDARSVVATLEMMMSPERPDFDHLVRSVFGAEVQLPTEDRLREVRARAERAFFVAFPTLAGRPYTEETIREGHSTLEPESTYPMKRLEAPLKSCRRY